MRIDEPRVDGVAVGVLRQLAVAVGRPGPGPPPVRPTARRRRPWRIRPSVRRAACARCSSESSAAWNRAPSGLRCEQRHQDRRVARRGERRELAQPVDDEVEVPRARPMPFRLQCERCTGRRCSGRSRSRVARCRRPSRRGRRCRDGDAVQSRSDLRAQDLIAHGDALVPRSDVRSGEVVTHRCNISRGSKRLSFRRDDRHSHRPHPRPGVAGRRRRARPAGDHHRGWHVDHLRRIRSPDRCARRVGVLRAPNGATASPSSRTTASTTPGCTTGCPVPVASWS